MSAPVTLRPAEERDVATLLALINGYAARGLLLPRTEAALRQRLGDFTVAVQAGRLVGCGALSELGPGLGEVRSLAVAEDAAGLGIGHLLVEHLFDHAAARGFKDVIALTLRQSFFEKLGFAVTERERFVDKLRADCAACPRNVCCDEIAMVRRNPRHQVNSRPVSPMVGVEEGVTIG